MTEQEMAKIVDATEKRLRATRQAAYAHALTVAVAAKQLVIKANARVTDACDAWNRFSGTPVTARPKGLDAELHTAYAERDIVTTHYKAAVKTAAALLSAVEGGAK